MAGYEVSNFAISPRHRSRHNLKYWNHAPYLGLGPSAHSFRRDTRWWNLRDTEPWQQRIAEGQKPVAGSETLEVGALVLEALMLGLRTYAGVDLGELRSRWQVDLVAANPELIPRLQAAGLVALEGGRLVPRPDGLIVADSLAPLFEVA
jgi:oxygen-independent coproporphyrinogen-3 oxidase